MIVILSLLPWSRYGSARGLLSAWRPHWSLVAVLAALAGLAFALAVSRRPFSPLIEASVVAAIAVIAAIASILHHYRPPPLSAPTVVPVLAVVGSGLALAGAASTVVAGLRPLRRHP